MSVLDVLDDLNIQNLKVLGDEIWGLCPRHLERAGKQDRTASWSINQESLLHHCFSCGYSGSLIGLTVDLLDITEIHAARWVCSKGLFVTSKDLDREKLQIPQVEEAMLAPFTDPPERHCEKKKFTPATASLLGVRWRSDKRAWICPVRDPWTHRLWGWQEKFTQYKGFKNYPTGVKKSLTLFGIDHVPVGERLAIVESPLDVVRLRQVGIYAVSTWGAHMSEAQLRVLISITNSVVLFYDNDESGHVATKEVADMLKRRPMSYAYADYQYAPKAKDPGDMEDSQASDCYRHAYRRMRTLRTGQYL